MVRSVVYMIEELQWALNFDNEDNDEKTAKEKEKEKNEMEMKEVNGILE